jgi:hypothetical protein
MKTPLRNEYHCSSLSVDPRSRKTRTFRGMRLGY